MVVISSRIECSLFKLINEDIKRTNRYTLYMYLCTSIQKFVDKVERFGCQLRRHQLARLSIYKHMNYYVSAFINQYYNPILTHIILNINRTTTLNQKKCNISMVLVSSHMECSSFILINQDIKRINRYTLYIYLDISS